jgi:phospholipid/cholesterol/gamma-HCH transport system substrate-binding protein
METTAKYRLMGAFTLAAILGVFAFVYWLNHGGGLGERSVYHVKFLGAVPGLRPGAAVQFNGIRVGEVTDLQLDPTMPQQVMATISIERSTPIRADTQVSLDFQGLMGVTSVALKGGSPQSPGLASAPGSPPLLVAEASAGADLTATAREALRRLDGMLADNSDALRGTIDNLKTFTGALAKNSSRIDGIVAGLERMTGGDGGKAVVSFDLTAPSRFSGNAVNNEPVNLADPTTLIVFDTQKLILRSASGTRAPLPGNGQWIDTLPKLVLARMVQAFESAANPGAVARNADNIPADRQLLIDIRSFEVVAAEQPVATVELAAKVVGEGNRVAAAKIFTSTSPVAAIEPGPAAAALNQAFGQVATDIVVWTQSVR